VNDAFWEKWASRKGCSLQVCFCVLYTLHF
jgi:hypothetical protein